MIKRLFDLMAAGIALAIFSPLLLVVARSWCDSHRRDRSFSARSGLAAASVPFASTNFAPWCRMLPSKAALSPSAPIRGSRESGDSCGPQRSTNCRN